jgi:hypothetical protein
MTKINQNSISGIDKDNIEEKDIQIDISTITEELRTLTYNEDNTRNNVLEMYEELFHKSVILINKYIIHPRIDNFRIGDKTNSVFDIIYLHPEGSIVTLNPDACCSDDTPTWISHKVEDVFDYLYSPQQILYNIYKNLIQHIKSNNEKIKELKLALYFMNVL